MENAIVSGASSERGRNIRLSFVSNNFKAVAILNEICQNITAEIESWCTIAVFRVMTKVFGGVLCSNFMENLLIEFGIGTIAIVVSFVYQVRLLSGDSGQYRFVM